jgi:hypothetical protein
LQLERGQAGSQFRSLRRNVSPRRRPQWTADDLQSAPPETMTLALASERSQQAARHICAALGAPGLERIPRPCAERTLRQK